MTLRRYGSPIEVCLALVAREQGLVMDDIAAALSVY